MTTGKKPSIAESVTKLLGAPPKLNEGKKRVDYAKHRAPQFSKTHQPGRKRK